MTKFRKTEKGVTGRMMSGQVDKSKRRGHLAPSYNLKQLREFLYSKTNFLELYSEWVNSDYDKWKRPTCDRLDDSKPYSLDNIQVVTWRENDDKARADQRAGKINSSKPMIAVTNGEEEFISMSEASRITGADITSISDVCKGKRITAGGYKWKFIL